MFEVHQTLLRDLQTVCYDQAMVQNELINFALRLGIKQSPRKIKFLETLSSGYYQNISNKKTGIEYDIPKNLMSVKSLIKFILKPETFFRYVVKLNHKLYKSNKTIAFLFPSFIVYGYYKFNKYVRYRMLKNLSLLKFNYFR